MQESVENSKHVSRKPQNNDVHFYARYWYMRDSTFFNGKRLYMASLLTFVLQILSFLLAIMVMTPDKSRTPVTDIGSFIFFPLCAVAVCYFSPESHEIF